MKIDSTSESSPPSEPAPLHPAAGGERWTVYDASPALARPLQVLRDVVRDCWAGRELAGRLFLRNIRGMYRQTLLGLFWIVLPPLANTAIWLFLRSRNVFSFSEAVAVDPAVFILAGMILWQAFLDSLQMPLEALEKNRSMISKLNFPRESLLMEGLADILFHLAVRLVLLVPVAWLLGSGLSWAGVAPALILALLLVLLGLGMGLFLAPLGALYHDVGRFIAVAGPFWMILTPVIYWCSPEWPQSLLVWLNPAAPLLVAARDLMVGTPVVHGMAALIWGAVAVPLLIAGMIAWRVSIPSLVERMTS